MAVNEEAVTPCSVRSPSESDVAKSLLLMYQGVPVRI